MAIEVTDAAIAQVKKLVSEGKVAPGALVRFGAKGGGCSGYSYVLDFAAKQRLGDRVVEKAGVKFLIDAKSLGVLDGSPHTNELAVVVARTRERLRERGLACTPDAREPYDVARFESALDRGDPEAPFH